MSYETETAGRYRQRAAQLRLIADCQDQATTLTLLGVAQDYDLMAMAFDGIHHANIVVLRARNSH